MFLHLEKFKIAYINSIIGGTEDYDSDGLDDTPEDIHYEY